MLFGVKAMKMVIRWALTNAITVKFFNGQSRVDKHLTLFLSVCYFEFISIINYLVTI